jgi:hypothetical protein
MHDWLIKEDWRARPVLVFVGGTKIMSNVFWAKVLETRVPDCKGSRKTGPSTDTDIWTLVQEHPNLLGVKFACLNLTNKSVSTPECPTLCQTTASPSTEPCKDECTCTSNNFQFWDIKIYTHCIPEHMTFRVVAERFSWSVCDCKVSFTNGCTVSQASYKVLRFYLKSIE